MDVRYKDVDKDRSKAFLTLITEEWVEAVARRDIERMNKEVDIIGNLLADARSAAQDIDDQFNQLAIELEISPLQWSRNSTSKESEDWHFAQLDTRKSDREKISQELDMALQELRDIEERLETEPERGARTVRDRPCDLSARAGPGRGPDHAAQEQAEAHQAFELAVRPTASARSMRSRWRWRAWTVSKRKAAWTSGSFRTRWSMSSASNAAQRTLRSRQLRTAQSKANDDIEQLNREVTSRGESYRQLNGLYQERTTAFKALSELRREEHAARTELAKLRGAQGQPLELAKDPTLLPTQEPNPWILVLFSVFAGLALGFGLALLLEYGRNSYRSVHDLTEVMNVPVLGAVSRIWTREEQRRAQMNRALVGVSSAILLGGALLADLDVAVGFLEASRRAAGSDRQLP